MWILPTMSRPEQCAEVLKSIGPVSKGVIFINGLSHIEEYQRALPLLDGWVVVVSDTNLGCIGALNKALEMFPDEDSYIFVADDEFLLEAPVDFEKKLTDAAGDWGISHGLDNLHNGQRLQGYVCFGGNLLRTIGYWGIKECRHSFGFDNMFEWLASPNTTLGGCNAIRVTLIQEIKVEHRHWGWGKAKRDDCYALADASFEEDRKRFIDWQNKEMRQVAARIIEAKRLANAQ